MIFYKLSEPNFKKIIVWFYNQREERIFHGLLKNTADKFKNIARPFDAETHFQRPSLDGQKIIKVLFF